MEVVWLSDYFIVPPYGAPPAARLIDEFLLFCFSMKMTLL